MSTNQVKVDPIESQLKRGGRGGGAAVYRATQSSAKGGGAGGPGPSASAPPHSNHPAPNHPGQHSVRPNPHGNAGGRRKPNGPGWHYPNSANGEALLQPGPRPQQVTANSSGHTARRPVHNNGAAVKQPIPPGTPEKPQPDTPRATAQQAMTFQFGSVSPAFGHNAGMQIPARTTSAPPNLDEQKREQAQFEAARAAKHLPVLPHGPVLDHPNHLSGQLTPSQAPLPIRPVHMQMPIQVVASQPQGTIQQPLQQPVLQHVVQPPYSQGTKFQQPPPVIASQVATSIVGPQPMVSQIGHPPQYPFFQPRTNKAIKIVNPQTQEEVRFDNKILAESRPPVLSAPLPRVLSTQQPRPLSYTGGPQLNHFPAQTGSFSATGAPFFPQNSTDPQRFMYGPSGPYPRGTQAASSVATPGAESSVAEASTGIQDHAAGAGVPIESGQLEGDAGLAVDVVDDGNVGPDDATSLGPEKTEPAITSTEAQKVDATVTDGSQEKLNVEQISEDPNRDEVRSVDNDQSQDNKGLEDSQSIEQPAAVEASTDKEPLTSSVSAEPEKNSEDDMLKPEIDASKVQKSAEPGSKQSPSDKSDHQHSQPPEVVEVKQGNKKKNKKKLLAKADAAGTTADLYNAYKAPDEKKQELVKPVEQEEVETKSDKKPTEVQEQAPKELDDWEDAADLPTPSPKSSGFGKGSQITTKRYTRDFLLTCRDQHLSLPADFEVRPDIEVILIPQSDMGGRGPRRGVEEDRWTRPAVTPSSGRPQDVRVDGMGPLGGFRPGALSPGMRFPSPMLPNLPPHMVPGRGVDALSWIHPQKGLIPSPHTPAPAMHKAEKRYEIGKVSDEEEAKQRQVKAILNKLTPQNFEKLFEQVQELGIETAATLTGVISQIFDKAVMEPTFCETYARFCVQLSVALPEFTEDGEKVTFKRVLLNKCQEEFERGKREEEEAGKIEEDGVSFTPEEREIKRVKARRRMLGNIRFIGELYKNSMLTERIMHQCIKTLLGEYQNPDEEDVEALCKLMTTIGHLIDHNKAKAHMDAYFHRISELSNNQKLPSRLRFGLKDVIDLRRNDWQQRRKVEGPKKIEEVHRDAQQERLAQTSRDRFSRGMNMSRRMPPPSPGAMSPMARGMPNRFMQDVRKEETFIMESRPMPMPTPQRPEEFNFVPQGGLGRGPMRGPPGSARGALDVPPKLQLEYGRRPGTAPSMDRGPYTSRDEFPSRTVSGFGAAERPLLDRPMTGPGGRGLERSASDRLAGYNSMLDRPATPPTPAPQPALTEEQLKKKSSSTIEEYYSARDVKEVVHCVEELGRPDYHATMISQWISESFERKEVERDLLAKLIIHLRSSDPAVLTSDQMREGFASVLSLFEDLVVDVPRAADYLGSLMGKLVARDVFPLVQVSKLVKEGGMEKDSLLLSKDALNIFGAVLEAIRKEKNEGEMLELYRASGISIHGFVLNPRAGEVEEFLRRKNLVCLDPIFPVEAYLKDALENDRPVPEVINWLEANAASLFTSAGFLRMLMTQVLNHTVLPLPADDYEVALKGRTSRYSDILKRTVVGNSKVAAASQKQYILAVQQFAHAHGHPSGLMTALFNNFYADEVISESAFFKWQDDVNEPTPGREQAIREVGKWLVWLAEAPEEDAGDD